MPGLPEILFAFTSMFAIGAAAGFLVGYNVAYKTHREMIERIYDGQNRIMGVTYAPRGTDDA